MIGLLLYAYCEGITSSRKFERATYDSVAFRVLSLDQHPDHDTISAFRRRHLDALSELFTQVLGLCQKGGLVKLGHVALDGTKVKANASNHKAMSYGRMQKKASELVAEFKRLLAQAEATDAAEDAHYGKGKRGDEPAEGWEFVKGRLERIRGAMAEFEAEAEAEYATKQAACEEKLKKRKQRNFTDPDSRIMLSSGTFVQAYNCQAAVDEKAQIILAADVTQDANDKNQTVSMVKRIKTHTGQNPKRLTADSGYYNQHEIQKFPEDIDAYIATQKHKHTDPVPKPPRGRIPKNATPKDRMARKLRTIKGRCTYAKQEHIVEPVFGQIKQARGIKRFTFRGIKRVTAEWNLICITHNLLKLYRHDWLPSPA